jgi:hypothetical protein
MSPTKWSKVTKWRLPASSNVPFPPRRHGAATVETDDYTLEHGGETLKLVTQKTKEEMVFQKHMAQQ